MHKIDLPYGKSEQILTIPDEYNVEIINPNPAQGVPDYHSTLLHAMDHPLSVGLENYCRGKATASIAINDKTRPVPHDKILPPLLQRIEELGVPPDHITFIIAVGSHDPMTVDEFSKILPEPIISKYRVVSHNCDDEQGLVFLGTTSRGTPIFINKQFYSSDIRIVVGNIEPHHFQGYSGGVKSASIGLAGRRTINHNHSLLADPHSKLGEFFNNPCRQDVEEIGDVIGVHIAFNVVMNSEKSIISAFLGSPRQVMETGIKIAQQVYETKASGMFDVVIASVGGYPKDINLYQSQKALAHSAQIVKEGGIVIIVAECIEGIGSHSYETFMQDITNHQQVFEKLKKEGFKVGPHKALLISRDALKANVILVSSIAPEVVRKYLLIPFPSAQAAIDSVLRNLPKESKIAVLPKAATTIPSIQ